MPPRPDGEVDFASPDTVPPTSPPVTYPGYEVLKELGRGNMGVVYLARKQGMGRLEVLKVVQAGWAESEEFRQRFAREVQNAGLVQHPNIVLAYHTFTAGPSQVLAMEYIDGCNLKELMRRNKGPLPIAHACAFARQAALGLQAAHEKGLVHRDIKPDNLMVSRLGVVKIVDFGLAKVASETANTGLTRTGMMMGTPDYMAPEQARDAKKADIRADIYALGCTLFHLLAGKPPFAGASLYEVMHAHVTEPVPPLAGVPAGLAALVARMLAKKPEDRPQTPGEVARALAPFCRKAVAPKEITNSIGMKLLLIPAGTFLMGSPEGEKGRGQYEHQHEVRITRPFYLGAYQVTQGEYERVMGDNPSWFSAKGVGKDKVKGLDTSRFPVERVSWDEAVAFCRKLTEKERNERKIGREQEYRLPSEAEWEYSCRGGAVSKPFHFGDSLSSKQANFDGNFPYGGADKGPYLGRTEKVGSYPPNAFGLYDMHGNVWEWCADWYDEDSYKAGPFPRTDPQGPPKGSARVYRGGSWFSRGQRCRSAHRGRDAPSARDYALGFRVALVPPGE